MYDQKGVLPTEISRLLPPLYPFPLPFAGSSARLRGRFLKCDSPESSVSSPVAGRRKNLLFPSPFAEVKRGRVARDEWIKGTTKSDLGETSESFIGRPTCQPPANFDVNSHLKLISTSLFPTIMSFTNDRLVLRDNHYRSSSRVASNPSYVKRVIGPLERERSS